MPFVIQHKQTKELFKAASGKTSWQKAAHAKNAFANTVKVCNAHEYTLPKVKEPDYGRFVWDSIKFDEQDVWEIVELKTTTEINFGNAIKLLEESLDALKDFGDKDSPLVKNIEGFLNGNS